MALVCSERGLSHILISFPNLMVLWLEIYLWKNTSSIQLIKQFIHYWNGKLVWNCGSIWSPIIDTKRQLPSFVLTKITRLEKGLMLGWIMPVVNMSLTNFSISFFWACGYRLGLVLMGYVPSFNWIWWSIWCNGNNPSGLLNILVLLLQLIKFQSEIFHNLTYILDSSCLDWLGGQTTLLCGQP